MEILLFSGLLLALLAEPVYRRFHKWAERLFGLFPLVIILYLLTLLPALQTDAGIRRSLPWIPSLEINFDFYLDGLSWVFALLISGIGLLVVIYASDYLHGHPKIGRFYTYLLLFMVSMLGLVWSDNLYLLFIFWEMTSISSFLLIGFEHDQEKSRKAALQALLVTGGGGLALLAGLVLLNQVGGAVQIQQLIPAAQTIRSSQLYMPVLILILIGAFTKSAQFPFHFWLPGAMAAPTPVSAYLHSATMVKAGVYLLARLLPVLGGTPAWQTIIQVTGLVTLFAGALIGLAQTDLKKILAYTTVAALGTLTFLFGVGSPLAVKTGIAFLLAHGMYKGSLFFVAGGIDDAAGTRDVHLLSGLRTKMPRTALAAVFAGISMIGLPPTIGFITKELVYETSLGLASYASLITGIIFLAFAAITAAALWVFLRPWIGKLSPAADHAHENSIKLWGPPVFLGVFGILSAIFPAVVGKYLVEPAVGAVLAKSYAVKLALWYGFTPMLWLSFFTILLGGLIFALSGRFQPVLIRWLGKLSPVGPENLYQLGLVGLKRFAAWQTRVIQNGYLRIYLLVVILSTVGLISAMFVRETTAIPWPELGLLRIYDIVLVLVILAAVIAVVRASSRLATIAILGLIGYSIALIYLLYGAPDLAMVQFAIETLTVILFVLVIYRLPKFTRITSRPSRMQDVLVALITGALMSVLVLVVAAQTSMNQVTQYYVENSLPLGRGRNIVNVILVDFRGLDTLGEISVLALAAIGVYALVKFRKPREKQILTEGEDE